MTQREKFIKTLQCEKIGGQVPHFEMAFYLTMEVFGRVHPSHRLYNQWSQMSYEERKLHMNDMAELFIQTAKKYRHSAIFVRPNPSDLETTQWLLEIIREKVGDEYYLTMHGDPTWAIPDGDNMMDFAVQMYEEPEKLKAKSKKRVEEYLDFAMKLDQRGHLLDGFNLNSDYCFNTNPFFSLEQFEEFIVPDLREVISEYHKMKYYVIKHTDGNVMPILKQIVDCRPDAIHSLDPQGGVDLVEARKVVGNKIALIGNVNCGLLQTGTDEECKKDILRALCQGMEMGCGYIFSTSNCVYTGIPLKRYEMMVDLWEKYGWYDEKPVV